MSSYEIGDVYSEVTFFDTDLESIKKSIENNESDWQETIYNYAFLWKLPWSYLPFYKAEICGVYDVECGCWIDYELKKTESDSGKKYVLKFNDVELPVTSKVGLGFATEINKEKIL